MNLDAAVVRIRERTATEVLDVTFLFLKAHARAFAALACLVVLPVALVAGALLGALDDEGWGVQLYAGLVVAAGAGALVRGPTLLLCGQAMFDERATFSRMLPALGRQLGSVLALFFWRAALAATVLGLVIDGLRHYFRDEVLLLERPERKELRERMAYLRRRFGPDGREQAAHHLLLTGAFVVGGWSVWVLGRLLFTSEAEVEWWPRFVGEPALVASFLLAQVYLAAAHFLYYLNLRTVNEGWDLFLETRALQARLDRRAAAAAALLLAFLAAGLGGGVARADEPVPAAPPSLEGGTSAGEEVREVLRGGRYPWYDESTDGPSWELLRSELEVEGIEERGVNWVAWVLNALAFAVLVGVLWFVIRSILDARRRAPPPASVEDVPAPVTMPFEDPELGHDPEAWLRNARALAEAGDYPAAIVHLFNHQLLELDRARRIRLGPGRTNRHYLMELGETGGARLHFRSAVRTFERVFYGGRGADREAWERFEEDHRRLVASLQRPAA